VAPTARAKAGPPAAGGETSCGARAMRDVVVGMKRGGGGRRQSGWRDPVERYQGTVKESGDG
jgi:hypothetical protein